MEADQKKALLEVEQAKGERYGRAWEETVKPFFEAKEADLIQAFRDTPSSNSEALVMVRMQFNALESLKAEFKHHIETGKMAQTQLELDSKD